MYRREKQEESPYGTKKKRKSTLVILFVCIAIGVVIGVAIGIPVKNYNDYMNTNPRIGCTIGSVEGATIGECNHYQHLEKKDNLFTFNGNASNDNTANLVHLEGGNITISGGWSFDNKVYIVYVDDGSQYAVTGDDYFNETAHHPANYYLSARVGYGPGAVSTICRVILAVLADMQKYGIENPDWREHQHYCK